MAAFVSGALISAIVLGWIYAGRAPEALPDASPSDVGPSVTAAPSPAPETVAPTPDVPRAVPGPAQCTERPQGLESKRGPALVEGRQIGQVQLGRIDPACWNWEGDKRAAGEGDVDAAADPLAARTPGGETGRPTRPPVPEAADSASPTAAPPPIQDALRPSISPGAPVAARPAPKPRVSYAISCCRATAARRPPRVRTGPPAPAGSRTIVRAKY